MLTNLEQAQAYVRENGLAMIDFKFSDLAGLDGIQQRMDPHELGFGPIDQNIFAWSDEQRKTIKPLPRSLQEALEALERDHQFLLQGQVFDEGQIAEWIKVKYEEHYAVRNRPHPYEMELYFDA